MSKLQRLPRGGKKINYTLYMSPDDKKKIQDQAAELEMSEAYYVVKLNEIDSELGLAEHLLSGGMIELVPRGQEPVAPGPTVAPAAEPIQPGQMPVPKPVSVVEQKIIDQEFKDNLKKQKDGSREELKTKPVHQVPLKQRPVRPRMRQIQDLVMESTQTVLGAVTGAIITPDMNKVHEANRRNQSGEAAFRKNILENLPPKEE